LSAGRGRLREDKKNDTRVRSPSLEVETRRTRPGNPNILRGVFLVHWSPRLDF